MRKTHNSPGFELPNSPDSGPILDKWWYLKLRKNPRKKRRKYLKKRQRSFQWGDVYQSGEKGDW